MLEALTAFAGRTVGGLIGLFGRHFLAAFRRPRIRLEKAPRNLLEHLKPAASQDRVRTLLGPPHQVVSDHWYYRFADSMIQIEFWNGGGAKTIALGLVGTRKRFRFPIPICAKPLGQISIADVLGEQAALRFRSSLRHEEVVVEERVGLAGAWSYWTFGAMMTVAGRALHESDFEWDRVAECLKTPPSLILANWVAVSDSPDEVYFDWSIG